MTKNEARLPDAGDIVWVDFEPVRGSEQRGARPAIVLTSTDFHKASSRAIVCPITSNATEWPTKIKLPDGMKTSGHVMADQVRAVHRSERGFRFIERAPEDVVSQVRQIIAALLGIGA